VPDKVRIAETIAAGQRSIEHLMGSFEAAPPRKTHSLPVKAT